MTIESIIFDMNTDEENSTLIKKILAFSLVDRETFSNDILGIKATTLKAKLQAKTHKFTTKEVSASVLFAKNNGVWDEYGFKYKTDDISTLWKVIIDFSLLTVSEAARKMGIHEKKVYRYYRAQNKKMDIEDMKSLLRLAYDYKLRVNIEYMP